MIPEKAKYDVEKSRQQLIDEMELLKKHRMLLQEVMLNANQDLIHEQEKKEHGINDASYRVLLEKTEASVFTCTQYISECDKRIAEKEEKIRHCDILLNSSQLPCDQKSNH